MRESDYAAALAASRELVEALARINLAGALALAEASLAARPTDVDAAEAARWWRDLLVLRRAVAAGRARWVARCGAQA